MEEQNKKLTKKERYEITRKQREAEKEAVAKKKKAKKLMIWGGTLLVIAVSLWGVVQLAEQQATPAEDLKLENQVTSEDHVAGNAEAAVVLVEYGDFQCPACASYEPMLHQMMEEYNDQIAFVFRHFPLRQIHKNAQLASQATVAAEKQGMFWEMHDALYEVQSDWANEGNPEDKFVEYAEELGLDTEQFRSDMTSSEATERVNRDYDSGFASGVSGTPTFFLNGEKIKNPRNYDDLKSVIDQALAN